MTWCLSPNAMIIMLLLRCSYWRTHANMSAEFLPTVSLVFLGSLFPAANRRQGTRESTDVRQPKAVLVGGWKRIGRTSPGSRVREGDRCGVRHSRRSQREATQAFSGVPGHMRSGGEIASLVHCRAQRQFAASTSESATSLAHLRDAHPIAQDW